MADNFEQTGHVGPEGGDPPNDAHKPSPAPPPPRPAVNDPPAPAIGPPSAYRAPTVEPIEDESIKMSAFPVVLGIIMAGVLVAAWFANMQKEAPAAATTPPAGTSSVTEPTPTPTPTVDVAALEGKVKELAGKVDELTDQVETFEGKLNNLPKPEPAGEVKALQGKLDELEKSVAAVGPLNDKVGKLGNQVGSVERDLKSIKGDLAALRQEVRKATTPTPAYEPKPPAVDTAAAMTGGVDLFKAGKYKEADDVFKKLASAGPKDARVYYFAALTRGLTTNDWQGETLTTAAKGAELEKAGSPKAPEVDAAFADLPSTLKPWITFFRQQAK